MFCVGFNAKNEQQLNLKFGLVILSFDMIEMYQMTGFPV